MQVYNGTNVISEAKIQNQGAAKPVSAINNTGITSFNDVLSNKIAEARPLQFSKHASLRLNSRELSLSGEQIKRVEDGIVRAREKGINESLVLVDSVALVVNVKNRIVVTAMNKEADNIFTNIDGAVIV